MGLPQTTSLDSNSLDPVSTTTKAPPSHLSIKKWNNKQISNTIFPNRPTLPTTTQPSRTLLLNTNCPFSHPFPSDQKRNHCCRWSPYWSQEFSDYFLEKWCIKCVVVVRGRRGRCKDRRFHTFDNFRVPTTTSDYGKVWKSMEETRATAKSRSGSPQISLNGYHGLWIAMLIFVLLGLITKRCKKRIPIQRDVLMSTNAVGPSPVGLQEMNLGNVDFYSREDTAAPNLIMVIRLLPFETFVPEDDNFSDRPPSYDVAVEAAEEPPSYEDVCAV